MPDDTRISFNLGYLKSLLGILRIVQVALAIVVIICASGGWWNGFVIYTSTSAIIYTVFFTVLFLFNIPVSILWLPWTISIFIANVIFAIFYVVSFIIACANASHHNGAKIAIIFMLLALIAHLIDAFMMFKRYRTQSAVQRTSSPPANLSGAGEPNVTTTRTTWSTWTTGVDPGIQNRTATVESQQHTNPHTRTRVVFCSIL